MTGLKHEADVNTIVRIELETINEKPFFGQASDEELLYIWVQVFKRKKSELFGTTSSKSLTRNVRAIYKLNEPIRLEDLSESATFSYEKYLDDGGLEVITGKILGYGAQKPAEIGDQVKVQVKTNFGVQPSGIINWLKLYGSICSPFEFVKNPNTGLRTDVFEVELTLRRHIKEFLPMYGQKVTVSYPGIPKMCNRCYTPGHLRRDCNNKKRDWAAYIVHLTEVEGVNAELIGSWKNAVQRWKAANISANRDE